MNTIPYHRQLEDDIDPQETAEWLEALVAVMEREGQQTTGIGVLATHDAACLVPLAEAVAALSR